MSLFLSDEDLVDLTGFKRRTQQAWALGQMKIPYKERPDGRLLVLRRHFDVMPDVPAKPAEKALNLDGLSALSRKTKKH